MEPGDIIVDAGNAYFPDTTTTPTFASADILFPFMEKRSTFYEPSPV